MHILKYGSTDGITAVFSLKEIYTFDRWISSEKFERLTFSNSSTIVTEFFETFFIVLYRISCLDYAKIYKVKKI